MKRAFTLIELLVVIAIIAILAAILFPVFAQAKTAAKGTASLSNTKQIGIAVVMYTGDYDDTMPLHNAWGDASAPVTVGGVPLVTWAQAVMPYMKSGEMLNDPLAAPEVIPTGWPVAVRMAVNPSFGYNYSTWNPYKGPMASTPWVTETRSSSSVAAPADTVLLGGRTTRAELGGLYWYGAGTMITSTGLEPPDCSSRAEWCFAGWGVSQNVTSLVSTKEAGKYTGSVSRRKSLQHVIVMGDSHAVMMPAGRLAAGTNFADNTTQAEGDIVVSDRSKYMWDEQ